MSSPITPRRPEPIPLNPEERGNLTAVIFLGRINSADTRRQFAEELEKLQGSTNPYLQSVVQRIERVGTVGNLSAVVNQVAKEAGIALSHSSETLPSPRFLQH